MLSIQLNTLIFHWLVDKQTFRHNVNYCFRLEFLFAVKNNAGYTDLGSRRVSKGRVSYPLCELVYTGHPDDLGGGRGGKVKPPRQPDLPTRRTDRTPSGKEHADGER